MTKDEMIALLRSGPDKWNDWYEKTRHGPEPIDLQGADLRGLNLTEVRLQSVNLAGATFHRSNLHSADLTGATLIEADLREASLSRADLTLAVLASANLSLSDLSEADFIHASLAEANLTNTQLISTRFRGVNLNRTNFRGAKLLDTAWTDVDLSNAIDLEFVDHLGPSAIDISTLFKSRGLIPKNFLRGCGVPEDFIEHIPSLVGSINPNQFYYCFISHSSKDKEFCRRLHSRMQQEKLRVWFDEEDMKAGRKLHEQISEAIRVCDKLLLVMSEHSMNSEWVETEIYQARQREIRENRQVLFPIRLCDFETIRQWQCFDTDTGKDLAREIRDYYIPGDFQNWKDHDAFEAAFEKLLEALRVDRPPPAKAPPNAVT